jgi:hypothetical protein
MFTGMAAVWAGVLLMTRQPSPRSHWFAWSRREIPVRAVEEPYLARVHGETYRVCVISSGRLLPSLSGVTSARTGSEVGSGLRASAVPESRGCGLASCTSVRAYRRWCGAGAGAGGPGECD